MNTKKWLIAALGVFIAYFAMEFVVHGVIMKPLYEQTASVWRPEEYMRKLMLWMMAGQAIFSVMFVLIYAKGYDASKPGPAQGARYGLLIGLLTAPMGALVWYAILPIPETIPVYWFVSGLVESVVIGAVAGALYR